MKNKILRALLFVLAICVFAAMAIGSGSSDEPATENTSAPINTANQGQNTNNDAKEKVEYAVGETSVVIQKDSIGSKWIKAAVPVTNTGDTNLYLESSSIDIENANGTLVETLSSVGVYPQIIKPGETAYYFEETLYDGTEAEGLRLVPHVKAEKAKVDLIRFEVSDLQIKDDNFIGVKVLGRVQNTSNEEESLVYVIANFFDKDGKFIGQAFTILTNALPAGDKTGFEINSLSSRLKSSDIATYDVIAFPYQYQW